MAQEREGITKLTVNLPDEAIEALRLLADERKTTMTEVLRAAIGTEKFLSDKERAGAKVLVRESDESVTRVIFNSYRR
jgi:predicted transcriptional regulator